MFNPPSSKKKNKLDILVIIFISIYFQIRLYFYIKKVLDFEIVL